MSNFVSEKSNFQGALEIMLRFYFIKKNNVGLVGQNVIALGKLFFKLLKLLSCTQKLS